MHQGPDGLLDSPDGYRRDWVHKQRQGGMTGLDAQDEGAARPIWPPDDVQRREKIRFKTNGAVQRDGSVVKQPPKHSQRHRPLGGGVP